MGYWIECQRDIWQQIVFIDLHNELQEPFKTEMLNLSFGGSCAKLQSAEKTNAGH